MDKKSPDEGPVAAACEILNYLIEHPDAKDTMEGIIKWWLAESQIERKEKNVQEAIDFLVSKRWMVEREITPKVYGVNNEHFEDIKRFLRDFGNGREENSQET